MWTILGVSAAVVAVFCGAALQWLVGEPLFEQSRGVIALFLGAFGVGTCFLGRFLASGWDVKNRARGSARFVLLDLRYWGTMLIILGVITLFIDAIRFPKPTKLAEQTEIVPGQTLQGIFLRDDVPAVILGGETYRLGDKVGGVTIKNITSNSVVVTKGGEEKVFYVSPRLRN